MSLHAALYDSLSSAGSTGLVVWVVSVPGLDDASWASAGAPNDSRAGEGWKSDDAVVCVMHVLLRHLSLVKLDPWHDDRVGKFQCLTQGGGWWRWHTAPLTAKRDHSPRWRIDPTLQRTLHHSSWLLQIGVWCHHTCCVSTRLHCQHCVCSYVTGLPYPASNCSVGLFCTWLGCVTWGASSANGGGGMLPTEK